MSANNAVMTVPINARSPPPEINETAIPMMLMARQARTMIIFMSTILPLKSVLGLPV
jgi:hypothetical protein